MCVQRVRKDYSSLKASRAMERVDAHSGKERWKDSVCAQSADAKEKEKRNGEELGSWRLSTIQRSDRANESGRGRSVVSRERKRERREARGSRPTLPSTAQPSAAAAAFQCARAGTGETERRRETERKRERAIQRGGERSPEDGLRLWPCPPHPGGYKQRENRPRQRSCLSQQGWHRAGWQGSRSSHARCVWSPRRSRTSTAALPFRRGSPSRLARTTSSRSRCSSGAGAIQSVDAPGQRAFQDAPCSLAHWLAPSSQQWLDGHWQRQRL